MKPLVNCAAADSGGGAERARVLLHRSVAPPSGELVAGVLVDDELGGRVRRPGENDRRRDRHADAVRSARLPAVRDGRARRQRDGRGGVATATGRRILVRGRYDTTAAFSVPGDLDL